MMNVLLERSYQPPLTPPVTHQTWKTLYAQLDCCLETRGARWIRSLISQDGQRSLCLFEVDYAEVVRESCREARLSFERVWRVEACGPENLEMSVSGQPLVIVERACTSPSTPAELACFQVDDVPCLREHNVQWIHSLVSPDRGWAIGLFRATNTDTVRSLFRKLDQSFERVWSATVLEPQNV